MDISKLHSLWWKVHYELKIAALTYKFQTEKALQIAWLPSFCCIRNNYFATYQHIKSIFPPMFCLLKGIDFLLRLDLVLKCIYFIIVTDSSLACLATRACWGPCAPSGLRREWGGSTVDWGPPWLGMLPSQGSTSCSTPRESRLYQKVGIISMFTCQMCLIIVFFNVFLIKYCLKIWPILLFAMIYYFP